MSIVKKSCNKDKKTDCLINALSLGISTNLSKEDLRKSIEALPMLSRQASHNDFASPSQSQVKDKPKTTQEICGHKQSRSSKSLNQNMLFLKTSPGCYLQNQVWMKSQGDLFHTVLPFSGTWMKQGIMLSGQCWELQIAERHTKGKGSGFWPTPNVCGNYNRKGVSKTSGDGLATKVKVFGFWRTPHASDGEGGIMEIREGVSGHYKLRDHVQIKNRTFWPMPRAGNPGSRPNLKGGKILAEEVKKWPTPTTRDYKDTGNLENVEENCLLGRAVVKRKWATPRQFMYKDATTDRNKSNLGEQVQGQLNPDWVEWLMGWPVGWSSLEPTIELFWLDWDIDPADKGNIPRVATKIKDRVNRLKAIGNGQVPRCAATAWEILIKYVR